MNRLVLSASVAAMLAAPISASADANLRFAYWLPPQHAVNTTGFEPWIQSINEASGGGITVESYPAQQLGSAVDHYDMARDGIADITFVNPGYQPGRFPIIALGEQPFLIANGTTGSKAFDAWYREYAETEMADVHVCMSFLQDPGTFHSVAAVQVPADVDGMNVRPAHATMGRFVNLLGGASVQVPAPEAREVIARGAADAITFPWDSIFLFGIDAETKHHIDMALYSTTFVMAFNKATYDGLSADDRAVIDAHCTGDWAEKVATGWAEIEAAGKQKAIDAGHTIYQPTAQDMQAWREAAAPLMTEWEAGVTAAGADPEAVRAGLVEQLKGAGALAE